MRVCSSVVGVGVGLFWGCIVLCFVNVGIFTFWLHYMDNNESSVVGYIRYLTPIWNIIVQTDSLTQMKYRTVYSIYYDLRHPVRNVFNKRTNRHMYTKIDALMVQL